MSALLALYLVQHLLLPGHATHVAGLNSFRRLLECATGKLSAQAFASEIFGLYTSFVYLTPILGGLLADRVLGVRNTVILGAILLIAGHLAMAFDQSFLAALLLLVVGTGCLKGNISTQVGGLYADEDDEHRTQGYVVFSIGISLGAMLGPVVCGSLAQVYGWHAGFGAAAAFMALGLVTYLFGLRFVPANTPRRGRQAADAMTLDDTKAVLALTAVVGITVFQTAAYDQSANVGLVWIAQHVKLQTPLGNLPEAWFPSIDALAGILVAPVLIALWRWRARLGLEPSPLQKIALGAAIAAASSLALAAGAAQGITGQASVVWPVIAFIGFGIGYMHYWPTCLALVSRAAPTRMKGTLMSLSFLGFFFGNLAMGWFGTSYERLGPVVFWVCNAAIALTGCLLATLFGPPLERLLSSESART